MTSKPERGIAVEPPVIRADRFVLRLAEPSDIPQVLTYRRTNADFFAPFEPLRAAGHLTERYWQRQVGIDHRQFEADQAVRFYIFDHGEPAAVLGLVAFSNIIRGAFQSCFVGYALDEAQQGRGLMTEALRLGIEYMQRERHVHRISANYLPDNTRSAALLRRLGFTVEGYARDYLRIDGRWQDHVLTSLLDPDWTAPDP